MPAYEKFDNRDDGDDGDATSVMPLGGVTRTESPKEGVASENGACVSENICDDVEVADHVSKNEEQNESRPTFLQALAYDFATNLMVRLLSLLLIVLDLVFVIVELSLNQDSHHYTIDVLTNLSLTIVCYFVVEVSIRIYGYSINLFFSRRHILDVVDFIVIICSFVANLVLYCVEKSSGNHAQFLKLVILFRGIRALMLVRFYNEKKNLEKAARKTISQNKMRYVERSSGFDLDLAYINDRVIVMSFPSSGVMALYRNPIGEVVRFFRTKHKDKFKIYNLCAERDYDASRFDGRVERFMIDDHNVPPLTDLKRFAESVGAFLAEDEGHVVSVHCKGGKGRSGTMICTWLLHNKENSSAREALDFFGQQRTDFSKSSKFQGVETPSQSRYVGYYELMLRDHEGQIPPPLELVVKTVKIRQIARVGNGDGSDFTLEFFQDRTKVFDCHFGTGKNCFAMVDNSEDVLSVDIRNCPPLKADTKLKFTSSNKKVPVAYDKCAFFFWFHTSFIDPKSLSMFIPREELDNPHKSKTWKTYGDDFGVEVIFGLHTVLDTNTQ